MALQGLVDLSAQEPAMVDGVSRLVDTALNDDAPSIRARARKLKKQLDRQTRD